MKIVRTGNKIEFRNALNNLTGFLTIADLGALAATGSKVPVWSGDKIKGYAVRVKDKLEFACAERVYTLDWQEYRIAAQVIGSMFMLRRQNDQNDVSVKLSGVNQVSVKTPSQPPAQVRKQPVQKPRWTRVKPVSCPSQPLPGVV